MFEKYDDIMTVKEVGEALRIGSSLTYRLLNEGGLQHVMICGCKRVPKKCLIAFVEQSWYYKDTNMDGLSQKEVCA